MAPVLLSTTRATDTILKESSAVSSLERTLDMVIESLRRSSNSRITITADSGLNSILTLQVLSSANGVNWGAEMLDGTFVDDWSTTFRRVGNDLVRQTTDDTGTVVEQWVIAVGIQDPAAGGRGFEVTVTTAVYAVSLNVTKTLAVGGFERSGGSSVFVRN